MDALVSADDLRDDQVGRERTQPIRGGTVQAARADVEQPDVGPQNSAYACPANRDRPRDAVRRARAGVALAHLHHFLERRAVRHLSAPQIAGAQANLVARVDGQHRAVRLVDQADANGPVAGLQLVRRQVDKQSDRFRLRACDRLQEAPRLRTC